MSNSQNSRSVQSFPSSHPSLPSSGSNDNQACPSSLQSTLAGPSTSRDKSHHELRITHQTASGFAACLAADHAAVLHPDVDSPFTDIADVISRLLPYHVFQQPVEDLGLLLSRKPSKGKERARHSEIKQEIEDTRFALNCYKRLRKLEDRLYRAKIKSGTRPSPDGQAYVLAQSILETERSETATVSSELRNARNELDTTQREKRATSSAHPTVTTFRPTYYAQATPSQYYRTYSYSYTHPYNTNTQGSSALYSTPLAVAQATASTPSYTPSTGPIPVQLPVTSLSALHALGIVPVPAASLPPTGQPQPAAVLKGSTSNGTMLSLDINVSLLQSAQMSGLAILLNSLMSRGGAGTGQTGTGTTICAEPATSQSRNGVASVSASANGLPITTQEERDGTG